MELNVYTVNSIISQISDFYLRTTKYFLLQNNIKFGQVSAPIRWHHLDPFQPIPRAKSSQAAAPQNEETWASLKVSFLFVLCVVCNRRRWHFLGIVRHPFFRG